jgi:transposase
MKKIFIGVDFSKEKIDVVMISANGLNETAPRVFEEFKNNKSGYNQLVKWVKKNSNSLDDAQMLFCGENTGGYSLGLCNYLYGKGLDMWLENAKSIKDASGIRRLKTDRADASMIAEYAMRNYDKAVIYKPLSKSLSDLRELFLYRQMIVRERSSLMVRRSEKKLTMEKSHAKTVISQSSRHLITEMNKEIAKIDKQIDELINQDEELKEVYAIVTTIPGIGTQNAVCLMVYTDNFRKFSYNSRKIACYYGIAPFGKDSGTSVHTDPHVHFMANRQIKAILTQAALSASTYNPVIRDYYTRLLARGKKKQVALNNVKNKLIHIVTAMVRNHQIFNPEYKIAA